MAKKINNKAMNVYTAYHEWDGLNKPKYKVKIDGKWEVFKAVSMVFSIAKGGRLTMIIELTRKTKTIRAR